MPDFDAAKEVRALDVVLEYAENAAGSHSGNLTSSKLLEDAQSQFCKLSPENQESTVSAMEKFDDGSNYMRVIRGGFDQPVGVVHRSGNGNTTSESFLSLNCPFEAK